MYLYLYNLDVYLVILIVVAIHYFYWVFKNKWPSHYLSESDAVGFYLRVNLARYITFRILPVFFITLAISSIFSNLTVQEKIVTSLYAGFFHALFSNFRMLFKLVLNLNKLYKYANKFFQILFHLLTGILVIFTITVAGYLSTFSVVQKIIPTLEGLVDNVWAALITVLIAVPLLRFLDRPIFNETDVVLKNLALLKKPLLSTIRKESRLYKANVILVCSICIVENIQRPVWFRRLENLKARMGFSGTYGVMQVKNNKLISDVDSIMIAIRDYLNETANYNEDELREVIGKYNNDPEYSKIVFKVYDSLKFLGQDIEKIIEGYEKQDLN